MLGAQHHVPNPSSCFGGSGNEHLAAELCHFILEESEVQEMYGPESAELK